MQASTKGCTGFIFDKPLLTFIPGKRLIASMFGGCVNGSSWAPALGISAHLSFTRRGREHGFGRFRGPRQLMGSFAFHASQEYTPLA